MTEAELGLSFSQWQGSARHEHLPRGAHALREMMAADMPVIDVPIAGPSPREDGIDNWQAIVANFGAARALIQSHAPRRILTAGGDCSIDLPVIAYLRQLYDDLTVVWFDAHVDGNGPETSPSGSFHGMPVRCLVEGAPAPLKGAFGAPFPPERFRYVGVRTGDPGEMAFRARHALQTLAPSETLTGPVHIHFDVDILDPQDFAHLAYPEAGGPTLEAAIDTVSQIAASAQVVGLTITEFAPADEEAARAGAERLKQLVAAAFGGPL